MSAGVPTRKVGSITPSFGPIPVRLDVYSASPSTEKSGVKRSEYVKNAAGDGYDKVGRQAVNKLTGDEVDATNVVKLYECEDGTLIELTNDEIDLVIGGQHGDAELAFFADADVIGEHYLVDGYYQVRPSKRAKGTKKIDDPANNKAFAMLLEALKATNKVAILQYCMGAKPMYAALRSDGRLYKLKFSDEVREDLPMPVLPPSHSISDSEKQLAVAIVANMAKATADLPELEDTATERVVQYAEAKAKTGEVKAKVEDLAPPAPPADFAAAMAAFVGK